jgi:hypothetical protein
MVESNGVAGRPATLILLVNPDGKKANPIFTDLVQVRLVQITDSEFKTAGLGVWGAQLGERARGRVALTFLTMARLSYGVVTDYHFETR